MILYLEANLDLGKMNLDPSQEEMMINDIDLCECLKAFSVYWYASDGHLFLPEQKVTLDEVAMTELFDAINHKINWDKFELEYEGGRGGEDFVLKITKRKIRD